MDDEIFEGGGTKLFARLKQTKQSGARATVKPDNITQGNLNDTVGAVAENEVKGIMKSLKAMGRFRHEANATDPHTGIVYETEDNGLTSGFYRYVPAQRGKLANGGTLQMLAIEGKPAYNTSLGQVQDEPLDAVWVTIDTPDPAVPTGLTSVLAQGTAKGGR